MTGGQRVRYVYGTICGMFTVRPSWADAPSTLRDRVSDVLGSREVGCRDVHGGMSPGPAAVLTLADGRTVFVKAVGASKSAELYRAESAALALLPPGVPAPMLLGTVDTGDWFAVITSFVDGVVAGPPWTDRGIDAVEQACVRVAGFRAPNELPAVLPLLPDLDGWAKLGAGRDAWEAERAPRLAELVVGWRDWTVGDTLVHHDLRCDNAIIDESTGLATLVDWSFCSAGAAWMDRALMAADIVAAGHVDGPDAALDAALRLLDTVPAEASWFLIGLAGMWRFNSTLPPIPDMPTHRPWQRGRATALRPLIDTLAMSFCRGASR